MMKKQDLERVWVEGVESWLFSQMGQFRVAFYINIMFAKLSGPPEVVLEQMRKSIESKFYPDLLREFVRHRTANAMDQYAPRLMLFADLPVHKTNKKNFDCAGLNHGLHYNGFLIIPPAFRNRRHPQQIFNEKPHVFYKDGIERIVVDQFKYFSDSRDYAAKTLINQRVDHDSTIILPRAQSEVSRKRKMLTPDELRRKKLKDLQSSGNFSDFLAETLIDS